VDRVVAQEVLDRLQPLGIEAALAAMQAHDERQCDKRQQIENSVRQAQYEAARARRQYDAVDPDNRLVAAELERRWNEKLVQLRDLEMQLDQLNQTKQAPTLATEDRARLMTLGKDLVKAWNSPGVLVETRKKIIRLLVKEIIVDIVDDALALIIHWQGGDHTEMRVKKNKIGHTRWAVEANVIELVRVLARQLPDNAIAAILNRSRKPTAHGATWTRTHVCSLRNTHGIPVYRDGERTERGEITLDEAAEALRVSRATAYRMVTGGALPAQQLCAGAPWIIQAADLQLDAVRRDAEARRSRRPRSDNLVQDSFAL
jgi:excisionase family DNA binding protein